MIIKEVEAIKINPAPYNPRVDLQPGDEEYEKLKRSINEFGYVEPLIWNEQTGNLVGGHQRYKVLMESKPKHLQVSVVNLTNAQEKAMNIALNKIGGDWDEFKLQKVLDELNESDIDLTLTGFSEEELDQALADIVGEGGSSIRDNQELSFDDYDEDDFTHKCPKCGFHYNE